MNNNTNLISEEIRMHNIDIIKSSIVELQSTEIPKTENQGVDTQFDTIMHNIHEKRIKTRISVDVNVDNIKAEFIIDFHFKINNLNEFYTLNNENHPIFSRLLIDNLLDMSYSTIRGIVFEKISNSIKHGRTIILPILNFRNR